MPSSIRQASHKNARKTAFSAEFAGLCASKGVELVRAGKYSRMGRDVGRPFMAGTEVDQEWLRRYKTQ
jgi:hypothetical protein